MKWFFWPPFLSVSPFLLLDLARRQSYAYTTGLYTRPSLLLMRFVFRIAEASAKRVTGDEPQGTLGRVQTAGCLLPAFLCAHIERDVWVRGSTRPEIKSWSDIKFCAHAHCVLPRCCQGDTPPTHFASQACSGWWSSWKSRYFEHSARYTFLAILSYYFWSTIEQIATVMGNITGNEIRYRKILANTNSPVVPSMRKCLNFLSLQTKFRSTVAHICKHKKQFLKHTNTFLEHK